jgi:hypothetical protein
LYFGAAQQPSGLYGASTTNNPNSVFAGAGNLMVGSLPPVIISSASVNSNKQFTISWTTVPGGSYNVLATTNLTAPINWSNLNGSPIIATNTNTSYTVPGTVSGRLFIKIQQ